MQKERIDFIDALKGYTIVLVVIFHLTYFHVTSPLIRDYATPFFMQLFIFVSGLFYSRKKTFVDFFLNKINRLLIPLFFFYMVNYIIGVMGAYILGGNSIGLETSFSFTLFLDIFKPEEHFEFGGAIWFLMCLFFVYMIYYGISFIRSSLVKGVLCLALSLVGYVMFFYNIDIPYFIDSALSMMFFFFLGDFVKSKMRNTLFKKTKFDFLVLLLSTLLYVGIVSIFSIYSGVGRNFYEGDFVVVVLAPVLGIVAFFILAKRLDNFGWIKFFGVNSLIILGTHQIIINVLSIILKNLFGLYGSLGLCINLIITLLLEYLIIRLLSFLFPFFVGKKDLFRTKKKDILV